MLEVRDFKKRAKEGEMGRVIHRYYDRCAAPCTWDTVCMSIVWTCVLRCYLKSCPHALSRIQMTDLTDVTPPPFVCLVCNKMTKYPPVSSFLCMDMTYITCLLKDGFGFKESTVLQVRQFYTTQSKRVCGLAQNNSTEETGRKEHFSKKLRGS